MVLNKLTDVYAVLDLALADFSGVGDDLETFQKIIIKLKNRRGLLSELVNNKADSAVRSFAEYTAPETEVAVPVDHLG